MLAALNELSDGSALSSLRGSDHSGTTPVSSLSAAAVHEQAQQLPQEQLEQRMVTVADSVFLRHEQGILAHLRRLDATLVTEMHKMRVRVSDCEVKLLEVQKEEPLASPQILEKDTHEPSAWVIKSKNCTQSDEAPRKNDLADPKASYFLQLDKRFEEMERNLVELNKLIESGEETSRMDDVSVKHFGILNRMAAVEAQEKGLEDNQWKMERRIQDLDTQLAKLNITDITAPAALQKSNTQPVGQGHTKYSLQESVWDACFVQLFCASPAESVQLAVIYFLNICLQVALVILIFLNLSSSHWITEDDIWNLLRWRITVAHNIEYYHEPSRTSLATRVCSGDNANILAGNQALLSEELKDYIILNTPLNGPVLCYCALIIWSILILSELSGLAHFVFAVFSLSDGESRICNLQADGGDGPFSISSISYGSRLVSMVFLVAPRFLIAIVLGWAGLLYLANSSSMGDLVLNAMALGFVLDMDELMYVLVPARSAWILSSTDDIPFRYFLRTSSCGRAMGCQKYISFCLIAGVLPILAWTHFILLGPLYNRLDAVRAVMCGGKQNLVFTQDTSNNVVVFAVASESPDDRNLSSSQCTYRSCSVMQAIGLVDLPELKDRLSDFPIPDTSLAKQVDMNIVEDLVKVTTAEAIAEQPCLDVDYDEPARAALKDTIGVDRCDMLDADSFFGRCSEMRVRRFCPQTCNCQDVSWWNDRTGCPPSCSKGYMTAIEDYVLEQRYRDGGCNDEPFYDRSVNENVSFKDGNLTFFTHLVQKELEHSGKLDEYGNMSSLAFTGLRDFSADKCKFRTNKIIIQDVAAVAASLLEECKVLSLLDSMFDLDLCNAQSRFEKGLGSITAFCPKTCNVCPNGRKMLPWQALFADGRQHDTWTFWNGSIKCGYEWIFCGETNEGAVDGKDFSFYGSPSSGEKIYTFWGQRDRFYSFQVKAKHSTHIFLSIHNQLSDPPLYQAQTKFFSRQAQLTDVTFTEDGIHYIMIESNTMGPDVSYAFKVGMSSNDSSCALEGREQIRCHDALHDNTLHRVSTPLQILGKRGEKRLFKFWADPGVEYEFQSCSDEEHEILIFDGWMRTPAISSAKSWDLEVNSFNCSEDNSVSLKLRVDEPGDHTLVVAAKPTYRPRKGWPFALTMRCIE